jgi:peptidoglycan/xylan/chitin deacetylase (PgdA/CDA1 family)
MSKTVTIVMYHYVRDLSLSRYPGIKGLDYSLFREQLAYIARYYAVITAQDLIAAVQQNSETGTWDLPDNALLLTFDDGYADHYLNVFPLLDEAGVQGSFFPSAKAICERKVLGVNKIHFILSCSKDKQLVLDDIFRAIEEHRDECDLLGQESYYSRLAHPSRHDPAEVMFIKRVLQVGLPLTLREQITDELFRKYVSADEASFAAELYLSLDQIRCMARQGMYIGSHAYSHSWLDQLSQEEQEEEIDRSLDFLATVGADISAWIMCYPHGASNEALHGVLRSRGCKVGLTTQVGVATSALNPFLFPRLDTNDLPKEAQALPSAWTSQTRSLVPTSRLEGGAGKTNL